MHFSICAWLEVQQHAQAQDDTMYLDALPMALGCNNLTGIWQHHHDQSLGGAQI